MTTKQKYTIVNGEKIPSNVINKSLYSKIKKKIKKRVKAKGQRWGAYTSGNLVQAYKRAGGTYSGKKKSFIGVGRKKKTKKTKKTKKSRKRRYRMQNHGVTKDTVIYTHKSNEDPMHLRQYYIVKNIVFGYHPSMQLEDTDEGKKILRKFGQNYYITEVQEVTINGKPIGESFEHVDTVDRFLSRYKAHMTFPSRKKIRSRKVMP